MQEVSAEFLATIQESHVVVSKVEILDGSTGDWIMDLPVSGGYVTVSTESETRRSGRVQAHIQYSDDPESSIVPDDMADVLAPGRNDMRIWRGVVIGASSATSTPIFKTWTLNADWNEGTHDWTEAFNSEIRLVF